MLSRRKWKTQLLKTLQMKIEGLASVVKSFR